ncbi:hypothetical protein ACFW3Z_25495 [Nocardiopsis alba]|uniref:hypothetical protein n=1 Tax=Nocardiopsis alba TaxID=53437 RepID=UPI0033B3359C
MSEDVIRPRTVVDPALPEDVREDLLRAAAIAPHRFHRGTTAEDDDPARTGEVHDRLRRLREAWERMSWLVGILTTVLVVAGGRPGIVLLLAAYALTPILHPDLTRGARWICGLAGLGALAITPLWLFGSVDPELLVAAPAALLALLVGTVSVDVLVGEEGRRGTIDLRGRVLFPEDIDPVDHDALVEVQRTLDLVADARAEFGAEDPLDTARGLVVLRDQEWRIASLLARRRELRRDHLLRWQRATSERVREALRPQREHLDAIEGHIRARVARIVAYGRLVEEAVAAHLEWEQCEEAVGALTEYAELRAEASLLRAELSEVVELSDTAEAARRIRDESVARVHAAATGLDRVEPAVV